MRDNGGNGEPPARDTYVAGSELVEAEPVTKPGTK